MRRNTYTSSTLILIILWLGKSFLHVRWFRVLNVARRRLCLRFHPDKNPSGIEKVRLRLFLMLLSFGHRTPPPQFKEISQAKDVLTNADKRRIYDQVRRCDVCPAPLVVMRALSKQSVGAARFAAVYQIVLQTHCLYVDVLTCLWRGSSARRACRCPRVATLPRQRTSAYALRVCAA